MPKGVAMEMERGGQDGRVLRRFDQECCYCIGAVGEGGVQHDRRCHSLGLGPCRRTRLRVEVVVSLVSGM